MFSNPFDLFPGARLLNSLPILVLHADQAIFLRHSLNQEWVALLYANVSVSEHMIF
jgi:hypothetical protein